jgi:hypothetical protein
VLGEEAHRAQLLVLGSRGLGGLSGLLLGSVAVGLAARAACPVVVVRGEERGGAGPGPVVVGVDRSSNSEGAIAFAYEAAAARGVPQPLPGRRRRPDSIAVPDLVPTPSGPTPREG